MYVCDRKGERKKERNKGRLSASHSILVVLGQNKI